MIEYIPKHTSLYMTKSEVKRILIESGIDENKIENILKSASYVDAEPVVYSSWKLITFANGSHYKTCNNCSATLHYLYDFPRCWKCGAKMDTEKGDAKHGILYSA